MKILKKLIITLFIFQVLISGCLKDASRDNPLDPKSTKYQQYGIIRGKIYTYYPPFRTLSDVDIFLEPGYNWTRSDQDGEFVFNDLLPEEYSVYVSCTDYAPDTTIVNIAPGKEEYIQFNLNGLPVIQDCQIIVGHISRWWPPDDLYILNVYTWVTDPDGLADISSVAINLPEFNFLDSLNRTNNPAFFNAVFYENQLPMNSLHQTLGHPFYLNVYDQPCSFVKSLPIYVARIIDETPIALSPQRPDTLLNSDPHLEWQPLNLSYPFTFKIEVFRIEPGINTLVWSSPELPADSTTVQVSDNLESGSYFWTVSIVDEFRNWSRSKEALFIVK